MKTFIVEKAYKRPENITLLDWMCNELKHLPMSVEKAGTSDLKATRSEVKRWLRQKGTVNLCGEIGPHDPNENLIGPAAVDCGLLCD